MKNIDISFFFCTYSANFYLMALACLVKTKYKEVKHVFDLKGTMRESMAIR